MARWWRRTRSRNSSDASNDEIVIGLRGLLVAAKLPGKYEKALHWCVDKEIDSLSELKEEQLEEEFLTQGVGVKEVKYKKIKKLLEEYRPPERLSSSAKAITGAL